MFRPHPLSPISRRAKGFIPGVVMEINVGIAVLGIALAVLWPWSTSLFRPVAIEPRKAELVAPSPGGAAAPQGWSVTQRDDGRTVISKHEPVWQMFILPALLVITAVSLFVFALQSPFWVLFALLCGTWIYGINAGPGVQAVKIAKDGTLELQGSIRFGAFMGRVEKLDAKHVDTVLVHRQQPEAYLVFRDGDRRRGWPIFGESPAEAHAVAALVLARLAENRKPEAESRK